LKGWGKMTLSDSKILLEDAENLLKEIEIYYEKDLENGFVSPILRVRIKQYLDNVLASLEYATYEIFSKYCAKHIPANKLKRSEGRVYFPSLDEKSKFDNYINERFPKLLEEKAEIVDILAKYQPFPTRPKWLSHLKLLCNNNKHRYLSNQIHQTHTHIDNLLFPEGGGITGITFVAQGDTQPIAYNDEPLDLENPNNLPAGVNYQGSVVKGFYFTEIDEPVLKTLKRIYRSAPSIISDLENCL
jgi:hypothetical protein